MPLERGALGEAHHFLDSDDLPGELAEVVVLVFVVVEDFGGDVADVHLVLAEAQLLEGEELHLLRDAEAHEADALVGEESVDGGGEGLAGGEAEDDAADAEGEEEEDGGGVTWVAHDVEPHDWGVVPGLAIGEEEIDFAERFEVFLFEGDSFKLHLETVGFQVHDAGHGLSMKLESETKGINEMSPARTLCLAGSAAARPNT